MIRTLPKFRFYNFAFGIYVSLFFLFLFAPLVVTCIFAFNDSNFPSLPWNGFTLDWFIADNSERVGIFNDSENLKSIYNSFKTAFFVTIFSLIVGTYAALIFERKDFKFKQFLYFLALTPLVIPGVILGISLLVSVNDLGLYLDINFGIDLEILRPSFWLVVIGQFSFITTFVLLVVSARLKKFDVCLEEASLNLGASMPQTIFFIVIPFLKPALIGAAAVAFLMSFENFNTTLFLIGSDTTLPINLYLQVRDGSTPIINSISFLLIICTSIIAFFNLIFSKKGK
ncbi:ABC transporter permease [Arcobacter arenosus]|uniref:ABC transporter permease n=1 Tax=Arcobacter arenosus TaxID=2576037 RepID=A0A5R8XYS9_9BACT|nr:ABC transporter permease [Arcobacter arenosus]TLP37044.1 ABC transporter permease [Arcobacter arenosus]